MRSHAPDAAEPALRADDATFETRPSAVELPSAGRRPARALAGETRASRRNARTGPWAAQPAAQAYRCSGRPVSP
ncbi:hypothetical protein PZ61_0207645 [Streptomyces sp. MNU77]|nr:hypothetical protein PZ61_0207645 [Streptomyces sp. MNU77]OWA25405.1 hypothetical protein B9W61_08170 [Streptomyces sp. CS057]